MWLNIDETVNWTTNHDMDICSVVNIFIKTSHSEITGIQPESSCYVNGELRLFSDLPAQNIESGEKFKLSKPIQ